MSARTINEPAKIAAIFNEKFTTEQDRLRIRERMSPGGLRGLQIRWGALEVSSVGSTPMRSRQNYLTFA